LDLKLASGAVRSLAQSTGLSADALCYRRDYH